MRRVEFLLNEVRRSTDNQDVNGIPTFELLSYLNSAQRSIETLIFKVNPHSDMFKQTIEYSPNSLGVYELPSDCFSSNAISLVEARYSVSNFNEGYHRIPPISELEKSTFFGYRIENNNVIISGQVPTTQYLSIRVTYFRKLKTLGVRESIVASVVANTSITLSTAPANLYEIDDRCSFVDASGDQVVQDIYFTNTSGLVLTTTDTKTVAASMYCVAGADSTNKPELPDICETYLLDYVRQRIYTRNNYSDNNKQMFFTQKQETELISIFANNKKDTLELPITDVGFLTF